MILKKDKIERAPKACPPDIRRAIFYLFMIPEAKTTHKMMAANFAMTSCCNVIKMKEHISTSHLLGASNKKYQKYKKYSKGRNQILPFLFLFVIVSWTLGMAVKKGITLYLSYAMNDLVFLLTTTFE